MKQFKVGERVAFDFKGSRCRGKIIYIGKEICWIEINPPHIFLASFKTHDIKRLVKKKRLELWVSIYSNGFCEVYDSEEKAKSYAAMDGFIRTARFREVTGE